MSNETIERAKKLAKIEPRTHKEARVHAINKEIAKNAEKADKKER